MGLSAPVTHFGVHSVTCSSRVDGKPFGTLRVVKSATVNSSGKLATLMGGSSKFPWDVQETEINSEISLKIAEYPDWIYTLFAGTTPTDNAADASGHVSTLTNLYGTSVLNATTGIASVTALSGSEANLKFTKFIVKAASATTVNIYGVSDIDFGRGSATTFNDDDLTLLAVQTITSGAATNITAYGFKFTGGSGTIGMTTGDTAWFEVRPKNTDSRITVFGAASSTYPEFEMVIYAKKKGSGEMFELVAYRCKGEGVPLHFEENKFSEADIKVLMMYDSTNDAVYRTRRVTPISPT